MSWGVRGSNGASAVPKGTLRAPRVSLPNHCVALQVGEQGEVVLVERGGYSNKEEGEVEEEEERR